MNHRECNIQLHAIKKKTLKTPIDGPNNSNKENKLPIYTHFFNSSSNCNVKVLSVVKVFVLQMVLYRDQSMYRVKHQKRIDFTTALTLVLTSKQYHRTARIVDFINQTQSTLT